MLLSAVPPRERIITISDDEEIRPDQPNALLLRAGPNYPVAQAIDDTPRLVGDRLVVGEVRDGQAVLALMMSGCPTMTIVRAASPGSAFNLMAELLWNDARTRLDSVLALQHEEATYLYLQTGWFEDGDDSRRALLGVYELVGIDPVMHSLRLGNTPFGLRRLWSVENADSAVLPLERDRGPVA